MLRVVNVVEKDVIDQPAQPVVLAANVAADVLPDDRLVPGLEVAYREIFNAGGSNAYYAFGRDCSAQNYNAYLVPGQMLEVATLERVSMFSAAGTTISITRLVRKDLVQHTNIINQQ